jgi:hypothetical protein
MKTECTSCRAFLISCAIVSQAEHALRRSFSPSYDGEWVEAEFSGASYFDQVRRDLVRRRRPGSAQQTPVRSEQLWALDLETERLQKAKELCIE